MIKIKYFLQFICISILLIVYKLLGIKYSSILSGKLLEIIGPIFRSKTICNQNLSIAFPELDASRYI